MRMVLLFVAVCSLAIAATPNENEMQDASQWVAAKFEGVQRPAGIADRVIERVPMIAVFAVVVGDDMVETPALLHLPVGTGGADLNVLQIAQREMALLPLRTP